MLMRQKDPRSRAVEDIVAELKPLRPDTGDPRPDIIVAIDLIKKVAPSLAPMLRWREMRDDADRAEKALSALLNKMGAMPAPAVLVQARNEVEMWHHVEGPDPKLDVVKWLCANTACSLIEQFSNKEPSGALNRNLHCIAIVIYSILAPGQPVGECGLLRVCRKVRKWREDIRASKHIYPKKPADALH
jgi:hypothetical protein